MNVTKVGGVACTRCSVRVRAGWAFTAERQTFCLRCWLMRRALIKRSVLTAIVVGSLITLINHGNVLLAGVFPRDLYWKVPLSYCLPFLVATWGALSNSRS